MKDSNDDSNDDDEEEEDIIVYASFEEGTVDREIFQQPNLKFKVIGLDSEAPVVQLGDSTFKGVWGDTIGTKVFFEEDPSPEPVDPVFTVLPPKMLKYKCMTTKTLELTRIFLKPKSSENNAKDDDKASKPEDQDNYGEQEEVLELAQSTVNPDSSIDEVMKDIVEDSAMEIT